MTNEELNAALYEKMQGEQERYKAYLLTLSPSEILEHATEFVCRENILIAMENNNLENRRAKALLKSSTPLADVYKKYSSWECDGLVDMCWNAIDARAGEMVRAEFRAARQEGR